MNDTKIQKRSEHSGLFVCEATIAYQWNHAVYKRYILVFQRFHVSDYPRLGMIAVEDGVLQVRNGTMKILCFVQTSHEVILFPDNVIHCSVRREYLEKIVHVLYRRCFVERYPNCAVVVVSVSFHVAILLIRSQ